MKQKLLKTIVLALAMLGGTSSAWADNTVRYSTDGGSNWTEAADLNALNGDSQLFGTSSTDVQVQLLGDQTLTSRITWKVAHTLTITSTKNVTVKGPAGVIWFLANVNNAVLNIGSSDYSITLDGENKSHTSGDITRRENGASLSLTNVTFKDFNLNSACHLCSSTNHGNAITLVNVSIENCTNPSDAYIYDLRVANESLVLKGYLNIDNSSTGTAIYAKTETKESAYTGRIKVDDSSAALTATNPITIIFSETSPTYVPRIADPIVVNSSKNFTSETASIFSLVNENYGTFIKEKDLKLTQAYTLDVTDAGAATLVLPFASTIPSGASCYTLTHTSGSSTVTATPVETTLSADTPVLVNTAEGSYKFVSTATSGSIVTGSDPVTSGALTGVYSEKTFGSEDGQIAVANHYILNVVDSKLGFYKAKSALKVAANRAYLTATNVPEARALTIVFDDESTGVEELKNSRTEELKSYYNLSGQRVAQPTKGLYIVNGKKIVIK